MCVLLVCFFFVVVVVVVLMFIFFLIRFMCLTFFQVFWFNILLVPGL